MDPKVEETFNAARETYAERLLKCYLQVLRFMGRSEELAVLLTVRSLLAFAATKCTPAAVGLCTNESEIESAMQLTAMTECFSHYVGRKKSPFVPHALYACDDQSAVSLLRALARQSEESQIILWRDAHLLHYRHPPNSLPVRVFAPVRADLPDRNERPQTDPNLENVRKTRERALAKLFNDSKDTDGVMQQLAGALTRCGMLIDLSSPRENQRVELINPTTLHFAWLRLNAFLDRVSRSDLTVIDHYLDELRTYGLEKAKDVKPQGIVQATIKACERSAKQRLKSIQRRLFSKIGELGEHYGAEAGWLFLVDDDKGVLRAAVSHNSDLLWKGLEVNLSQGITGWVAREGVPRVVPDVLGVKDYYAVVVGTRSELAVPITSAGGKVIAVLNFESSKANQFCEVEGLRLTLAAARLSPDVIALRALENCDGSLGPGWHFRDNNQWSIGPMISEFCYEVQNVVRTEYGIKTAVIVWEYDEEKHVFHVMGTSGYDYEYVKNNGLEEKSFIGSVFRERVPISVTITEAFERGYRRVEKAKTMGVQWIAAAPFGIADTAPGGAKGVVTIYGFRNNEMLSPAVAGAIAGKVSEILGFWEPVRRETVLAYCLREVSAAPPRGTSRREALRDLLMEVFDADGCSIFAHVRNEEKGELHCVATTGLTDEYGNPIEPKNAIYRMGGADSGATVWLAENPGKVLRKLDATQDTEATPTSGSRTVAFRNKFRESAARSLMEGRRFLGCAASIGGKLANVIRLVRKASKAPFQVADGRLFGEIIQTTARAIPMGCELEGRGLMFRGFLRNPFDGKVDFENGLVSILESAYSSERYGGVVSMTGAEIVFAFREEKQGWKGLSLMACGVLKSAVEDGQKFILESPWLEKSIVSLKRGDGVTLLRGGQEGDPNAGMDVLVPFCLPLERGPAYFCLRARYSSEDAIESKTILKWVDVAYAASWWIGSRIRSGWGIPPDASGEEAGKGPVQYEAIRPGEDAPLALWEKTENAHRMEVVVSLGPWLLGRIVSSRSPLEVFQLLCAFVCWRSLEVDRRQMEERLVEVRREDGQRCWEFEDIAREFRVFCDPSAEKSGVL